jgi:hypothetical protein
MPVQVIAQIEARGANFIRSFSLIPSCLWIKSAVYSETTATRLMQHDLVEDSVEDSKIVEHSAWMSCQAEKRPAPIPLAWRGCS